MRPRRLFVLCAVASGALLPSAAVAFDSGSTGADGDLNPSVSVEIVLPPTGILNYRSVNIPSGVTVTFKRNATNTPVVMLVQGDMVIGGVIDVSGRRSADTGSAGDGDPVDDGLPGAGGPGGFDGGAGGLQTGSGIGGTGQGPGGGVGARGLIVQTPGGSGGNASFGTPGVPGQARTPAPPVYGNEWLMPLVGGSGGGGGLPTSAARGAGGGGGGGAILIAVSGRFRMLELSRLLADGGSAGESRIPGGGGISPGGCGSGGAIRIVASEIAIAPGAELSAVNRFPSPCDGHGGDGRIRLEADRLPGVPSTNPTFSFGSPGPTFAAGQPALSFASIAGIAVPAAPVGHADVKVPSATPNPATVVLETTGVPLGTVIRVTLTPQFGSDATSVDSTATTGTVAKASATASLDIPAGHSVLSAQASFVISLALGEALSRYAQGERVERITVGTVFGGRAPTTLLTTTSGRRVEASAEALALIAHHR